MTSLLRGWMRIVAAGIRVFAVILLLLATIWAAAAIYFDLPTTIAPSVLVAVFYLVSMIALLLSSRFTWLSIGIGFAVFAGIALWWSSIKPAQNRSWLPEVAETTWTERDGDKITIHNLRNFDYQPNQPAKPRWETKVVYLSQLQAVDLFINFWGSTLISHPIVSFQFGSDEHVAISVETRMAQGQSYSTIRGFFKQFALIYIVADERDVVRVRTNYRNEQLYLYRTSIRPERARALFLDYLKTVNKLHEQPRFYNAVTSNCTTNVRTHTAATAEKVAPWDWRMLVNGTVDQLVYERGGFASQLPFDELKARSLIDDRAKAADAATDFSERIRAGLPGFN